MPASKVRKKAKAKIAADRKRLREQDSSCADSCCGSAAMVTGGSQPGQADGRDSLERS
ncbi:hypothetical protein M1D88_07100 [Arthrobacter sp. R1-13]